MRAQLSSPDAPGSPVSPGSAGLIEPTPAACQADWVGAPGITEIFENRILRRFIFPYTFHLQNSVSVTIRTQIEKNTENQRAYTKTFKSFKMHARIGDVNESKTKKNVTTNGPTSKRKSTSKPSATDPCHGRHQRSGNKVHTNLSNDHDHFN